MNATWIAPLIFGLVLLSSWLAVGPAAHAVEKNGEAPRMDVPDDGTIVLHEYGYRDWGPELVHYAVDAKRWAPGQTVLLGPDGKAVPFQIEDGTLAFVASLPRGGTATYHLEAADRDRSAENTTLACGVRGEEFEIRNEHLALRMPAPGARICPPNTAVSSVPPPWLRWSVGGGPWMGGARFVTERTVASYAFRVVRQGPACVEYEARYRFAPRGEYVWRLRLSPRMPLAMVSEEFDFGEVTKGEDLLLLELHRGWDPKQIGWVGGAGEQQLPGLEVSPYASYVETRRKAALPQPPVGGAGQAPSPWVPEPGLALLDRCVPGGKWGGYKGGVQVWEGDGKEPVAGHGAGLVTLSVGAWRRSMALNVWHREGAGLVVGLPISVRHMRWSLDIADDFSPFSNHEHDPGLPVTYGRRCWGFWTGPNLQMAQAHYGHIGLDRYKDWLIDYPEGAAARNAYPGSFFSKALVERLRKTAATHPFAQVKPTYTQEAATPLTSRYLISGKTDDAVRQAELVIRLLKKPYAENDLLIAGLTNYRKSQLLIFANEAEDALACAELPVALRRELRRRLALYAYITSDPDWNPRGAGVHLGNNNMSFNRTFALAYFAGLLPDHPRYGYWMERLRQVLRFKYASQTAPDGPFIECPTYQTYAPFGALNITLNVLRNRGVEDFVPRGWHRGTLRYLALLTMPDARYGGKRITPGMGNSGNLVDTVWGVSVATFMDTDPAFAGWLRQFHEKVQCDFAPVSTGVTFIGHPMYYVPDLPGQPEPGLKTTFLPTYGVVFRAHYGSPLETAMLLRAGMNWSHWDTDCLNVILYGQGAPLSPGTGYQYYGGAGTQANGIYHNRVKVVRRDLPEIFGRVDDTVTDYGFGAETDYAVADRYYPPELLSDGGGEMHWRRHVIFLKSRSAEGPNYFVLRDTFPGGEERPKWWNWLNLNGPDQVLVDGQPLQGDLPEEKVLPADQWPTLKGRTVQMKTAFGASTWFWFPEARPVSARLRMKYGNEGKTIVEIPAGPRQDFHYVVFPLKDGSAPPACERPRDGVLRIVTGESTDTIFLSDEPLNWKEGDVEFSGKAGAVRVFRDRVALCLNAGSGRVAWKGCALEGHGPLERVIPTDEVRPGVHRVDDGYEKKIVSVDLGPGLRVSGEAPFEAKMDGERIVVHTQGRARVLHVTQPPFIIRPQLFLNGQEWMATWTDYPSSGWGTYRNTWLIGLSVPEGSHELVVRNLVYAPVWERTFKPLIEPAGKRDD